MSQVYTLEPPTKGKVVLRTTLGDIDIELWPKEAPRAVRNFVQLCLEGYYDGTIFHRVVKDFMAQGGDPTGTGEGGECIYGQPFADEMHSRLRFSHRGLLACANQNKPNTNGAQFFVTLDKADHLDRKATIFGKVTGDTIYNLLRFNELEVDEADRPVHPPVVTRADVLWNPFEDIQPRVNREAKEKAVAAAAAAAAEAEAKQARKGAKNFALMSFGDEAEEEEEAEEAAAAQLRIKSAHDALADDKLSKEAAVEIDLAKVREAMRAAKATGQDGEDGRGGSTKDAAERMRDRLQSKRKTPQEEATLSSAPDVTPGEERRGAPAASESDQDRDDDGGDGKAGHVKKRSRLEEQGRGRKSSAAVVAPSRQLQLHDGELLTAWERKRQEYKERKRLGGHREQDTMSRLASFVGKLKAGTGLAGDAPASKAAAPVAAPPPAVADAAAPAAGEEAEADEGYAGKVDGKVDHRAFLPAAWRFDSYLLEDEADAEGDDLTDLRGHRLTFQGGGAGGKDGMERKEATDDYVVFDPLLEKGKAKFNKQVQRSKKRENEWAGRSRD